MSLTLNSVLGAFKNNSFAPASSNYRSAALVALLAACSESGTSTPLDGNVQDTALRDSSTNDSSVNTDSSMLGDASDGSTPVLGRFASFGPALSFSFNNPLPALAVGPDNAPLVAYSVRPGDGQLVLQVSRLTNNSWSTVQATITSDSSMPFARYPTLLRSGNEVLLGFMENDQHFLYRLNGSSFAPLGSGQGTGSVLVPSVSLIAVSGDPWMAYTSSANALNTPSSSYVAGYANGAWSGRGAAFAPEGSALGAVAPTLATNGDKIFLLLRRDSFELYEWNGTQSSWTSRGPVTPRAGLNASDVSNARLAIASNGDPIVSYAINDAALGYSVVQLARYTGGQWQNITDAFHEDAADANTQNGSLLIGQDGTIFASYFETDESTEVFVRACNASGCALVNDAAVATIASFQVSLPVLAEGTDGAIHLLAAGTVNDTTSGQLYRLPR